MQGLPADHYTSDAVFARERERIFGRLWLFAGLRMMVARSGAYYARTLAGVPIVLQNLGGNIACFLNRCAHRGAELQPEGFGVRGFVCGYHGFRYAIDGSIAHIPDEQSAHRFQPEDRSCLRLRRFALREVGQLLFVSFSDAPDPIESQFSQTLLTQLEHVSSFFDTDVIQATTTSRYNWKLPGENLRDLLHPRFVHPQTLFPLFDFEQQPSRYAPEAATLKDVSFGGPEGIGKKDFSWPYWSHLERWPEATEHYYNWLLYPNLHIASHDGCRTFGIEQYDPVDAGTTRLVHFMLTSKRKTPIPYGDALLRGMLRGARTILDEDARIMEGAQRSLAGSCGISDSPVLVHGASDTSVARFVAVTKEQLDA